MENRETEKENVIDTSGGEKNTRSGNLVVNKDIVTSGKETGTGSYTKTGHPSRNLETRAQGYGIGGGYERSYGGSSPEPCIRRDGLYSALSHGGYYGAGTTARRFEVGQAGFREELMWYRNQYGDKTSKYGSDK